MKNNFLHFDVVILGAGPYGLSVAAHMRKKGLRIAVFGKPMSFWQQHMPKGMLLRSRWWANSLSDPDKKYSISAYLKTIRLKPYDPLPEDIVCEYGLWFQKHMAPNVDKIYIKNIKRKEKQFLILLADGRKIISNSVVMAPGLAYYTYRPAEFSHVPKKFISHTCDNYSFDMFKDKRIVVIGSGHSALENAALMSEAGIDVHLIHRSPLAWTSFSKKTLYQKIRYPKAGIADGWDNWILEHIPYIFQRLPRSLKEYYLKGKGANGPVGTYWLIPRVKNVTFHEKRIEKINQERNRVRLTLSDKTSLLADHIILATGYKIDVQKLPMLDKDIISNIKTYKGSPELNKYFESSIPGLYFCGISSHLSFGPLFRFVVGVDAAAKRITRAVSRKI